MFQDRIEHGVEYVSGAGQRIEVHQSAFLSQRSIQVRPEATVGAAGY